jgi:hypothetical protein
VTGADGQRMVAAIEELYSELGYSEAEPGPSEEWLRGSQGELWEGCEKDGSELVSQLRVALAKLAHAAQGQSETPQRHERAVQSALDGAELVMRGEIAARRPEMIGAHLPGFTFIVVLPGLGRERALKLSQRAAELVDGGELSEG